MADALHPRGSGLWPVVKLGEVAEIFDHRRVPLNADQRQRRPGPYPYHGAQDVIGYIDDFLFSGRYLLVAEDGENLHSRKLPLARLATGKFWVGNHAHVLAAKPEVADDVFLLASLNDADIRALVTGAAQPKLSQANLRRIEVPLPPLVVQRRIAAILSAYVELIDNCQQRIQVLEAMADRLYIEWFDPQGAIPKGWEVGRLQDVVILQRGYDLPKSARTGGRVPVYAATGVVGCHGEARAKAPSIVTGRSGTIGAVRYVQEDFWPLNTVLWARTFPQSEPLYAYFLLRSLQLSQLSCGAAVPTLNRNDVHERPVLIPSRSLQQRFQQEAGVLLKQVRVLELRIFNLCQARDLLLPQLVSGRLQLGGR